MGHSESSSELQPSTSNTVALSAPSASTLALLSITQDLTALISLSVEATASLVHDWFRSSLISIGLGRGQLVHHVDGPPHPQKASQGRGETGRGLAVVVVGAAESAGQSLTLHLAKSGYTVFPLLPLPPNSSQKPTSHALSSLLLMWSTSQKRLKSRYPTHPGSIVPIMTEEDSQPSWSKEMKGKGRARFRHAGETVRAYVAEIKLRLVAVICTSRNGTTYGSDVETEDEDNDEEDGETYERSEEVSVDTGEVLDTDSPDMEMIEDNSILPSPPSMNPFNSPRQRQSPSYPSTALQRYISTPLATNPPSGLLGTDESALLSLYRSNVLDPLTVIREFQDLLAVPSHPEGKRGRVVFVNSPDQVGRDDGTGSAMSLIQAARCETARLLRDELGELGVEVCEVAVGPMATRMAFMGRHSRNTSDASSGSGMSPGRKRVFKSVLSAQSQPNSNIVSGNDDQINPNRNSASARTQLLASRLALLAQLWAVDDALLYSSVRRAIEDRYPRSKHHAGLSPFVESVTGIVPGIGMVKALGRWVLGRLLVPRGS